jgi:hypothetical protein
MSARRRAAGVTNFCEQVLERGLSRCASASSRFSLVFSASSWRSRLASLTAKPPNLAFQR